MLSFPDIPSRSDLFRDVKIVGIRHETDDVRTFIIQPVEGHLAYKAGQFLTFVIATPSGLTRRSYSFSSTPGVDAEWAVTIKRIPNGLFSRPLFERAEVGDRLTVVGEPSGFFILPDSLDQVDQLIFLAAGSGITPVYSMLKAYVNSAATSRALLIYSNSHPNKTIFRKELEELADQSKGRLTIEWLFSNHHDLWKARLNKLNLDDLLSKHGRGVSPQRKLVYLCGPFDYMRMAAIVLQSSGIPADNIRREIFTPEAPVSPERPSDTNPHRVILFQKNHRYEMVVQFPDSILAVAKKKGIELPYSCEAGRCGSCVASCTKGKIWMRFNEVLTDQEVEKGRVLICHGFPVGGDAEIVID